MQSSNEAGAVPHGNDRALIRTGAFAALVALAGPALAAPAFFIEAVPFWLAGLPLLAGIWVRTPRVRIAAIAGWLAVPTVVSAIGLTGIGHAPELVWLGAAAAVLALAALAGVIGISLTTFALTLVPWFPASPLVALADVLPGYGLAALGIVALSLAWVEMLPRFRGRFLLAVLAALVAVNAIEWRPGRQPASRWAEVPDLRPRRRPADAWRSARSCRKEVLRFWARPCSGKTTGPRGTHGARMAVERDVTLFVGVTETLAGTDRGAVWRLDRETCAPGAIPAIATRAWLGIPGVTGGCSRCRGLTSAATWCRARTASGSGCRRTEGPEPAPQNPRVPGKRSCPGPGRGWLRRDGRGTWSLCPMTERSGRCPCTSCAGKAAGAMASLTKRGVAHAETGRTVLVRAEGALAR